MGSPRAVYTGVRPLPGRDKRLCRCYRSTFRQTYQVVDHGPIARRRYHGRGRYSQSVHHEEAKPRYQTTNRVLLRYSCTSVFVIDRKINTSFQVFAAGHYTAISIGRIYIVKLQVSRASYESCACDTVSEIYGLGSQTPVCGRVAANRTCVHRNLQSGLVFVYDVQRWTTELWTDVN